MNSSSDDSSSDDFIIQYNSFWWVNSSLSSYSNKYLFFSIKSVAFWIILLIVVNDFVYSIAAST